MTDEEAVNLCRMYLDLDANSPVQPRPYQARAVLAAIVKMEEGERSFLIAMATGTGKTVVFMLIAKYVIEQMGGRVLILAHRGELITQAANAAAVAGLTPAIEKADEHARPDLTLGQSSAPMHSLFASEDEMDFGGDDGDPKLVIASVQTMQRDRLKAWPLGHFSLIVTDECFPAGTKIDGLPIERIRVGYLVTSLNHLTWKLEQKRVVRLYKSKPSALVRVYFDDGTSLVCTPNHPVYAIDGISGRYLPACELTPREGTDETSTLARVSVGMGHGGCCKNQCQEGKRIPDLLQVGHREPGVDDCDRSGRAISRSAGESGTRRQEIGISLITRVDRVEVLEPGSDGRFGGLCPDGFVYNFEVEGNHNYFADGILVHNCHHATADTYRSIIDHLAPAHHLGVTATADRGDSEPICGPGQVYESLAFEYTITEGVESGHLSRPWVEMKDCDVDLSKIRTTGGDYNLGDIERAITPHIQTLVNIAKPYLIGRRFICFTPDVGSADAVASAFQSLGVSCESVSGRCTDRDEVIRMFRGGRYQGLCNCALLTEGFDAPFVDAIVLMRPTKSRALFTQMIGRGTRIYPGKSNCLVIAFNWKTVDHKLVKPVEIFDAADVNAEILGEATKLVESGECKDLLLALKRAKDEVKLRERLRIKVEEEKRHVKSVRYDPLAFDPDFIQAENDAKNERSISLPPTEKQADWLVRMGFKAEDVETWNRAKANGVLTAMNKRRDQGLATYKQVKLMSQLGIPNAWKVSFTDAPALIDAKLGKRRTA